MKSNASNVQPSQAAHQAYHWSLVGSLHQGMFFTVSTAAMTHYLNCLVILNFGGRFGLSHDEVGDHLHVLRLRTEQQSYDKVHQSEHRADRHRDRKAEVPRRVAREEGQNRRH